MKQLPTIPLSPEKQQKIIGELYLLLGKQVESYHKYRHMGTSSSVPLELAQDLMASIEYTVNQAGGPSANESIEETLYRGQAILDRKHSEAKSLLELVCNTTPNWQTDCRVDALNDLRVYLNHYDHLHLSHKSPEHLFYPILIPPPEGLQGIEKCLYYLEIMWCENQIMAGVPEHIQNSFWDHLPADTLNQCEHLLINGIGKALIHNELDSLIFVTEERIQLTAAMLRATEDSIEAAARRLIQWLNISGKSATAYVMAIVPQVCMWIENSDSSSTIGNIFQ